MAHSPHDAHWEWEPQLLRLMIDAGCAAPSSASTTVLAGPEMLIRTLISNSVFQTDVESLPRYKDGAPFSDLEIVQCARAECKSREKVEADKCWQSRRWNN